MILFFVLSVKLIFFLCIGCTFIFYLVQKIYIKGYTLWQFYKLVINEPFEGKRKKMTKMFDL